MKLYKCALWIIFIGWGCLNADPRFYGEQIFDDCFEGAAGWFPLNSQCIFPLTQFERNHSIAMQMCGAFCKPCLNNGTCLPYSFGSSQGNFADYNCTCLSGYSGKNCEVQNCPECQNGGTCLIDQNGAAKCKCTERYYGEFCEKNCFDVCGHASGCLQVNLTVWCDCLNGFSSQYCDIVDNVCSTGLLTCQNNGTCNPTNQNCTCTSEYEGKYCEIDKNICIAQNIQCSNNGTCDSKTGACNCPASFTGDKCENELDHCSDITCFYGGVCISTNSTCACPPGTTGEFCQDLGQPCKIQLANGTISDYCMNGGQCFELPEGAACDCGSTQFTGRRCEAKITFNFNLVFNGLPYEPPIVSNMFSNSSAREYTICSFIQYNYNTDQSQSTIPYLPPYLAMRSQNDDGTGQQLVFDNYGFHICRDQKTCVSNSAASNFKMVAITPNTWHHFCLVSPAANEEIPKYVGYLDGVMVVEQLAERFIPNRYGYLILAPSDLAPSDNLFQGMISMTQMYIVRLNSSTIGKLAFDCYNTFSNDVDLSQNAVIKWDSNFTRIVTANPGVYIDPAGICKSVKCMFGRQVPNSKNMTSTCDKDRIPPSVSRCPSSMFRKISMDFVRVEWNDKDVAFFDNIGIVKIDVNYHNGQQFGWNYNCSICGYDAAGNSAECTFDIIITKSICPSIDQIVVPNAALNFGSINGPFSQLSADVKCFDEYFPTETLASFYDCDIMGSFRTGGWAADTNTYYLPGCGTTTMATQMVNGTIVQQGTCAEVSKKLLDTLWQSSDCDELGCEVRVLPSCGNLAPGPSTNTAETSIALQYELSTKKSTKSISTNVFNSLNSNFNLVQMDSKISCNQSFPIHVENQNLTICVKCPEGTYADTVANECVSCPVDSYRNQSTVDQMACERCPENMTTGEVTGAVDVSQCYEICTIGQFFSSTTKLCEPCPIGTYGTTSGLTVCQSCDFDLSTVGDGSTSPSNCSVTCPAGQQMIRDETKTEPFCEPCPKGYYKTGARGACIQCPHGLTTTVDQGAVMLANCDELNCIDQNTMKNPNITAGPDLPYSELCLTCEQGQFQNVSNADHCIPCTELTSGVEIPVTCQSTCSPDAPMAGCDCQIQQSSGWNVKNGSGLIYRNCLPEVSPGKNRSDAVGIVLGSVFGAILLILLVVLLMFRKKIIAYFRKAERNDNQHVAPSFWDRPVGPVYDNMSNESSDEMTLTRRHYPHIPRPNLRIVTSRAELEQLPPLPSSSTDSIGANLKFASATMNEFGSRSLGTATARKKTDSSDDSSLGSWF